MSIHVALTHSTHYTYDRDVRLSPQLVRLRPAPHCRTPILSYSQRIAPADHFVNWQQDPQSNYIARVTFTEPVRELHIEIDLVAELSVYNPFDFFLEPHAETRTASSTTKGNVSACGSRKKSNRLWTEDSSATKSILNVQLATGSVKHNAGDVLSMPVS